LQNLPYFAAACFNQQEDPMPAKTSKRELIQPHRKDKRYVRRTKTGRFTTSQDDVGKSLGQDRRRKAQHASKKGQGDRGDRRTRRK
jgi:hypothetical protein